MDIIIVKGETLNWDEFREWFKKIYGWYPSSDIPSALSRYLKEKRDKPNEKRDNS